MCMTWSTLYNTLGVAHLWAAMRVEVLGTGGARATWTLIGEPLDMTQAAFEQFVQAFAESALGNVRRLLG